MRDEDDGLRHLALRNYLTQHPSGSLHTITPLGLEAALTCDPVQSRLPLSRRSFCVRSFLPLAVVLDVLVEGLDP